MPIPETRAPKPEPRSPSVSIIIPVKPGGDTSLPEAALARLDYPQEALEICRVEGTQPSRQRNAAAREARGEYLWFLDNDTVPEPEALKRAVGDRDSGVAESEEWNATGAGAITGGTPAPPAAIIPHLDPSIAESRIPNPESRSPAIVGGPNLTPATDSFWQKVFGCALASRFAHDGMAARYRPIGAARPASEKELILCALLVRRDVFLELGGFDENLYPNEENEFMNRVAARGYNLWYDPEVRVWRSRRRTIRGFWRQMQNYGRGRMEQAFVERFHLRNAFFLGPAMAVVTVVLGLAAVLAGLGWFWGLPAAVYFGGGLISGLGFAAHYRDPRFALILPGVYLIMHGAYSYGLLRAFVRRKNFQNPVTPAIGPVVKWKQRLP